MQLITNLCQHLYYIHATISLKTTITKIPFNGHLLCSPALADGSKKVMENTLGHDGSISLQPTRMWANAQRDGRPTEYRCRPLFNAAKFG